MSEIRTVIEIQDALDKELAWRVKEITQIRTSLRLDDGAGRLSKTMVRAGIALLYAHWEGFIKQSSEAYLEFVSNQNCKYKELKPCFIVFGLKKKLSFLADSKRHNKNTEIVDFLLNELANTAQLSFRDAINTEANLSSKVFSSIANSIGINIARYETKFNLIDESLLKRRNKIAHGEYLDIGSGEFATLSGEILQLMTQYKTDIENCISMETYKPSP